jgi:photosynthetic reaction center cytochrome c subunit
MYLGRIAQYSAIGIAFCCGSVGQLNTAAPAGKSAEQVYKNIQVLKGTPADQLTSSMQFMSSSLGVHCDHCHVEGAFDKDDKKSKQQAREMIKMVAELNHNQLRALRGVTCFSCHRGAVRPKRTPVIGDTLSSAAVEAGSAAPTTSAENLLARCVRAFGGAAALQNIRSEVQTGSLELASGIKFPMQISLKHPGMRSTVVHLPGGDSIEVENGNSGWSFVPARPMHTMSRQEAMGALAAADPIFLSHLKDRFTELRVQDKKINGVTVSVIRASNPNEAPVKLYVDPQTGLLMRIVRYVDSALGRNPIRIDYSDYRDVAGIKQPFRWTVAQPQGRFSVQLDKIEVNVPVDDSLFAKPQAQTSGGN